MSYYGYPQQFIGDDTTPRHPFTPAAHPAWPQQAFNIFTAPSAPRHPHYFGPTEHAYPRGHHHARHTSAPHHDQFATDLEAEERAALAHLQSIRDRREAERAAIRRELEQEREAAERVRRETERRELIRRALIEREARQAREAKEKAIIEAVQQRVAIERAVAERVREREQQKAEAERAQQIKAAIQAKRQAFIEAHRARQEQHQQEQRKQFEAAYARRAECAKRCAAKYAHHAARSAARHVAEKAKVEHKEEFEALQGILGMFGINLVNEEEEAFQAQKSETAEKAKEEKGHVKFADETKTTEAPTPTSAPAPSASTSTAAPAFPEDVNDLLTQFLGLRVEPTRSDKPSTASNKVPEGLNEFLSRFGLVFEPLDTSEEVKQDTTTAETSSSQATAAPVVPASAPVAVPQFADPPADPLPSTSTPAPGPSFSRSFDIKTAAKNDEAPLTSFLNSFTDLPPFVRDILGNVELAFKEEITKSKGKEDEVVEGKGKGVAKGEKAERPVPAPAPVAPAVAAPADTEATKSETTPAETSASSLSTLGSISDELHLVLDSFTFPSTLSFGANSSDATPALLFNKVNSPYHAQANKLLQLLLAADGVSSGGDKEVRRKRKEVVRAVEQALEALENKRDEVWAVLKVKRENGEVEVEESGSGSSSESGSTVDVAEKHTEEYVEHVEHPEADTIEEHLVQGFEVPSTVTPASDAPQAEAENANISSTSVTPADPAPEPVKSYAEVAHPTADSAKVIQVDVESKADLGEVETTEPEPEAEAARQTAGDEKKEKVEDGYELL